MHKIGIISDTHGVLRPEVVKVLQGCEVILHGGDFDTEEILEALEQVAPVYAVRGNNDYWVGDEQSMTFSHGKARYLPKTLSIELYRVRFFMVHDKKMIPKDMTAYDVIIYGHSHKYDEKYTGSRLWLNPGSCGPKRFTLPVTMALMEVSEDGSFSVDRINLEKQGVPKSSMRKGSKHLDIKRTIELVVRDIEKGIPVQKIAGRHGIGLELAEQICRLYLTHPGVDADGIMRKMGM